MFDEELLQSAFDWALRFYQRKGLNAQDAEDCAAEVRLHLLQRLQQGRALSFAYAAQVARGILADFVQAQQQRSQAMPLEYADLHRGGSRLYTNRASKVHYLPSSFRFPPLREGNRARRAYSVPPARRGNLQELTRVQRFGTESLQQGLFCPAQA
jgi:hypothetical protein